MEKYKEKYGPADKILEGDVVVKGYVCREVEGPLEPYQMDQGTHLAGFVLCSEEFRKTCHRRGHCRLLEVKMHFCRIPKSQQPLIVR